MKLLAITSLLGLTASAIAGCGKHHQVQSGEYCYLIAQNNGLELNKLYELNPGMNCDNLQVGQDVCIGEGSGCNKKHSVQSGEYCYAIAQNEGIDLDKLRQLNPGMNCDNLQIGEELCVSGGNGGNNNPKPQPQAQPQRQNKPAPTPAPTGGRLVTYDQFAQSVQDCGYPRPGQDKYEAMISSHASAGGITTKRELAMFLAEIMHESGGLQFKSELRCRGNNCSGDYRSPGDRGDKFYYGRGYIQLTWSYNYRSASKALYGDERLINDPESVANNEKVAWETTFWFWKTNVHSDGGVQNGQLGSATNKINGALECNPCRGSCNTRFEHYKKILKIFGVNENPNRNGC